MPRAWTTPTTSPAASSSGSLPTASTWPPSTPCPRRRRCWPGWPSPNGGRGLVGCRGNGRLRIGDFACGTGALLSAVYEQIAARHERAGGDAAALHRVMMEEVLYGCDVMPSAVHITGSTLSGVEPSRHLQRVSPVHHALRPDAGRQRDDRLMELLQSSNVLTLFNTSDPAMRTGSAGEETAVQIRAEVPDAGYDLVIMNPPFTSNTKHYDAVDGVVNAAFAAYDASDDDQEEMAKRLKRLAKGASYHGHAGLASAFVALANVKVRPGGVVAFVLPFYCNQRGVLGQVQGVNCQALH